jgi:hypothetical protein
MKKPSPVAKPKNGKYYTKADLPLTVIHPCGCEEVIEVGTPYFRAEIEYARDVDCFTCKAERHVQFEEEISKLRPLYKDRTMSPEEAWMAREYRADTFRDMRCVAESEIEEGRWPRFSARWLESLETAALSGDHRKNPRLWIPQGTEGMMRCQHEIELYACVLDGTLKHREAFLDVIAEPESFPAGLLEDYARDHITTPQDCLSLIASPSADIRALGIKLSGELNKAKPCLR